MDGARPRRGVPAPHLTLERTNYSGRYRAKREFRIPDASFSSNVLEKKGMEKEILKEDSLKWRGFW